MTVPLSESPDAGQAHTLPRRDVAPAPGPVSGASQRLRALAALSGSLTDALDPEEAASLVELKALSALGATSAVVVTLGSFPPVIETPIGEQADPILTVVHAIGLPMELKALIDRLPLAAPVPLAEVAREGVALFLPAEADLRRYPAWGPAMLNAGARAAAIVPVWANGELRGVLGLAWAEPRVFDEDERAFVLTLGVMCAQAIMRAHLRAAEKIASAEAVAAGKSAIAAREIAELANKSKSHFVATISHELRTPMNAVLGYTRMIADELYGPVNTMQRDHLARVSASGKHLLGLIEQLLGYARIEAGEETVRPERVMLSDLVEQSLVLVQPLAEQKGLRIRIEAPDQPLALYTDPGKVRQILVNLLANAVKFSTDGEVELLLRVEGLDVSMRVIIEVTDHGVGIASEHYERIFEPFWRADPTAPHDVGSTGLGLSVARQLARLLGGDVAVAASTPGRGSTVVLSLPMEYRAR